MNAEFMEALNAIEKERGISKDILIDAFESALIAAYKRNYGTTGNVRAVVDCCRAHHIPIRIGVNGGSLDKILLEKYGHTLEGKKRIASELNISLRTLYRKLDRLRQSEPGAFSSSS